MILKKPYGFLIKYFRQIHLILTAIYVFIALRVGDTLNFYVNYAKTKSGTATALNYSVSGLTFFAIILSMAICTVLFILMNYKKKPKLMYVLLQIVYLVLFSVLLIANKGLVAISKKSIETKTILLYRDFIRITMWFVYATIVIVAIRGLGFDIKKFNFKEDLNDIDLDITDSEEVELTVGVNSHKIIQKLNRYLREVKYFILENIIYVSIITAVILIVSIGNIIFNINVTNKVYKQNVKISADYLSLEVTNSYVTSYSYLGEKVSNDNKYILVALDIIPNDKVELNTANIELRLNDAYECESDNLTYFKDVGKQYRGEILEEESNYILIFEVPNDAKINNAHLIYATASKDINIKLSIENLDVANETYEYNLNDEIDFSKTTLKGSTLKITEASINNSFSYKDKFTVNNEEYETLITVASVKNAILNLKAEGTLIKNISINDFIYGYATVTYSLNGEEYNVPIMSDKSANGNLYFEVSKDVKSAENIWLDINARGAEYKYKIK